MEVGGGRAVANARAEEFRLLASRRRRCDKSTSSPGLAKSCVHMLQLQRGPFFAPSDSCAADFSTRKRYIWDAMRSPGRFPWGVEGNGSAVQ